jgi:hypothetical protein
MLGTLVHPSRIHLEYHELADSHYYQLTGLRDKRSEWGVWKVDRCTYSD